VYLCSKCHLSSIIIDLLLVCTYTIIYPPVTTTYLDILVGIPNRTSYAASKFAVQGYCESLRAELASSGVSVHVISPGYIRTNLSRSAMLGDGRLYAKMDTTTDNGADPQDVAATILEQVSKGKTDLVVAATFSSKVALWLKFFFPSVLQKLLASRFEKGNHKIATSTLETTSNPADTTGTEKGKIE
jgi:hypothetical protein